MLRLADLVDDPAPALRDWSAALAVSDAGSGRARLAGRPAHRRRGRRRAARRQRPPRRPVPARPRPRRTAARARGLVPAAGLAAAVVNVPEEVRNWYPGQPGLEPACCCARALELEAEVDADVAELIDSRDVAGGSSRSRCAGAPATAGSSLRPARRPGRPGCSASTSAPAAARRELSLGDELARVPDRRRVRRPRHATPGRTSRRTGSSTCPRPACTRDVDRARARARATGSSGSAPGPPAGSAAGDPDGTVGQAARLRVLLDQLATSGQRPGRGRRWPAPGMRAARLPPGRPRCPRWSPSARRTTRSRSRP